MTLFLFEFALHYDIKLQNMLLQIAHLYLSRSFN